MRGGRCQLGLGRETDFDLFGRRSVQNGVLGGGDDGDGFIDEGLADTEVLECGDEIFRDGVEVLFFDVEIFVGGAHVFTTPRNRATESGGQEGFLFAVLAGHVDFFEEVFHAFVGQDLDVEGIHRGIECGVTTEAVIEALLAILFELSEACLGRKGPLAAFVVEGDRRIDRFASDGAEGVGLGLGGDSAVGGGISSARRVDQEGNDSCECDDGRGGWEDELHVGWMLAVGLVAPN